MLNGVNNLEKRNKTEKEAIRSPFFYIGDKYKLMTQLKKLFPKKIDTYFDAFCGGGSASMNIEANSYFLNDINKKIIELHAYLQSMSGNIKEFINNCHSLIEYYGLSHSEMKLNTEIYNLKKNHSKTYLAKYNKKSYLKLRDDYNQRQDNLNTLYLLLIYGFNHMIRFNAKGNFNLPVGNVDWNKNVTQAIYNYACWYNNSNFVSLSSMDFEKFIRKQCISKNDFVYLDPPYLITFSDYNKLWNIDEEKRLYFLLDELNKKEIKWGLSNMLTHKGKTNKILSNWSKKYYKYNIKSNYISRFDNTIKKNSKEIYVTNIKI